MGRRRGLLLRRRPASRGPEDPGPGDFSTHLVRDGSVRAHHRSSVLRRVRPLRPQGMDRRARPLRPLQDTVHGRRPGRPLRGGPLRRAPQRPRRGHGESSGQGGAPRHDPVRRTARRGEESYRRHREDRPDRHGGRPHRVSRPGPGVQLHRGRVGVGGRRLLPVHRRGGLPPAGRRVRRREAGPRAQPGHRGAQGHVRVQGQADKAQVRRDPDRQGRSEVRRHRLQQGRPVPQGPGEGGGAHDNGFGTHLHNRGPGGAHARLPRIVLRGRLRVHRVPQDSDGRLSPVREADAHRAGAGGRPRSEGVDRLPLRPDKGPITGKPGSAC